MQSEHRSYNSLTSGVLIISYIVATILVAHLASRVTQEVFEPSGVFGKGISYGLILGALVSTSIAAYVGSKKVHISSQTWNTIVVAGGCVAFVLSFVAIGKIATFGFAKGAPSLVQAITYILSTSISISFVTKKIAEYYRTTARHIRSVITSTALAYAACFILIASAYAGVPGRGEKVRDDMRRIDALATIESAAYRVAKEHGAFPALLIETGIYPDTELLGVEPYFRIDESTIRLCTYFDTDFDPAIAHELALAVASANSTELVDVVTARLTARWNHASGLHCFERTL